MSKPDLYTPKPRVWVGSLAKAMREEGIEEKREPGFLTRAALSAASVITPLSEKPKQMAQSAEKVGMDVGRGAQPGVAAHRLGELRPTLLQSIPAYRVSRTVSAKALISVFSIENTLT